MKNSKVIQNERKEESIFIEKEWKGGGKTLQMCVTSYEERVMNKYDYTTNQKLTLTQIIKVCLAQIDK